MKRLLFPSGEMPFEKNATRALSLNRIFPSSLIGKTSNLRRLILRNLDCYDYKSKIAY